MDTPKRGGDLQETSWKIAKPVQIYTNPKRTAAGSFAFAVFGAMMIANVEYSRSGGEIALTR